MCLDRLLVIGVGNPDRGDDGVGRLVARLLRDRVPPHIRIEEQDGGAAELMERLHGRDGVFLIDAVVSGALPGTIQVIDCTANETLPGRSGASTHGLGVAEAVALCRLLHGLPRVCRLYAIEGTTFAPGAPMSPQVRSAAESLAARLAHELPSM